MLFRIAFLTAMFVLSLNISVVFNVDKANPIEKALVFISALCIIVRGRIDKKLIIPVFIMIIGTILSALLTQYPEFEWGTYLRQSINLITLWIFLIVIPREEDRLDFLRIMAFVPLLQVALGLVYAVLGIKVLSSVDATIGVARLGGSVSPPFLAGVAATGAIAAMFYAKAKNLHYLYLAGINLGICVLTAGRMATFVGVASSVLLFLLNFRNLRPYKLPLVLAGALCGGLLIVSGSALTTRAESGDLKGRDLMAQFLWSYYERFPDFGVGLGHQYTLVTRDILAMTGTVAAHNEYLKFLVELGQYGGLIFLTGWLILFVITLSSNINRGKICYFIVIVGFLIYSSTDNTFARNEISFMIVVAAYGTRYTTDIFQATSKTQMET
jgi:O-Antigen ligase